MRVFDNRFQVPEGFMLFDLDGHGELVKTAYRRYLCKFDWRSFPLASGAILLMGKKKGLWYEWQDVLNGLERPDKRAPIFQSARFDNLSIVYDRNSCWSWHGLMIETQPVSQSHVGPKQIYILSLLSRMLKLRPDALIHRKCENNRCVRPSHLMEIVV